MLPPQPAAAEAVVEATKSSFLWRPGQADLPQNTLRLLGKWSLRAQPEEACGFLFGHSHGSGFQIESISSETNAHANPKSAFQITALALMQKDRWAQAQGLTLCGTWHSHPAGPAQPSKADRENLPPEWLGLIVVPARSLAAPAWCAYKSAP